MSKSRTPILACLGRALPALPALLLGGGALAQTAPLSCPSSIEGHRARASGAVEVYAGEPAPNQSIAPTSEGDAARGRPNRWEWPQMGNRAGDTVVLCRYEGTDRGIRLRLTPEVKACEQDLNVRTFVCR